MRTPYFPQERKDMTDDPTGIAPPFTLSPVLFEEQNLVYIPVMLEYLVGTFSGEQSDGAARKVFPYGSHVPSRMQHIPKR